MVKEESEGSPRVYLTGLPQEITKSALRTFFGEYGTVLDVIFKYGADSKRIKGIAYVLFESQDVVDKLLEEKTVTIEETEVEVKKATDGEGKFKGEEPLLAVPKEALKCHVCRRDKFPSLESFINHKKGKQHVALLKLFRAKSAAVLQLLKAEAKLASDRSFDMVWMKKNPDFNKPRCNFCHVQINCNPAKHNASIEHKMVKNYTHQKCCDIEFTSRDKYETHLLSLKHLKTVYEKGQKSGANTDETRLTMKKAIDIYKQCDKDLKELKEEYGELDLSAELPAFDKTPIGLNYVVKKINYYCICCDQKFFANMNLVEPHCRSYNHYTNMTDHVAGVEKTLQQKRKLEAQENEPSKKRAVESSDGTKPKAEEKQEKSKEGATQEKAAVKTEVKEEEPEESMEVYEEPEDQQESKDNDQEEEEEEEEADAEVANEEEEEEELPENEEEEAEQEVEEVPEDEPEEEEAHEEEENVEEVGADSDVQAEEEDDDDVQLLEQEEPEDEGDKEVEEEVIGDDPVEETKEEEEEEEEVVEIEEPKPRRATARRARGRGRGRGLKR